MPVKQKITYAVYTCLTIILLVCGYFFEVPYGDRKYLILLLALIYLLCLGFHLAVRNRPLQSTTLLGLILITVLLEVLSKYAVNYFFHSLYLLQLILIIFRSDKRRGLILSIVLSLCSFLKFTELLVIQPSTGNIAMSVFFITTQGLLILVFTLYKRYLEESVRNKELYDELLTTHLQLKQYSEEIKHLTTLSERNKIARDLHDTLGHELTGLIMQMEMSSRLMNQDLTKGQAILEEAKSSARGSLSQVRAIVDTLKSDEEKEWTQNSIKELIDHFSDMTDVRINYDSSGEGTVNPDISLTLYRIVQEALTNAVRHGKASKINIHIDYRPEEVAFIIHDNGKGCLDPDYGNGLSGMKERIFALHGDLTFDGTKGFLIQGSIPIPTGTSS